MKIRIIGNSGSGKTTIGKKLSEYFTIPVLHMDNIAFVPNSDFELREKELIQGDISTFVTVNDRWIIEGNYTTIISEVYNIPDLIIFIDLPVEQSLYNFEKRHQEFLGRSRPELPNLIETDKEGMVDWINSYPQRRVELTDYVLQEQMQNPLVNILHIEDMGEVKALSNNPHLIEGFFE